MRWLLALFVILLIGGLAALFTAAACAIRRDVKERFEKIHARLREDAEAIVRNLPHDQ